MDARSVAFGVIEIEGKRFEHDVVIDRGRIGKRHKGPSKARARVRPHPAHGR